MEWIEVCRTFGPHQKEGVTAMRSPVRVPIQKTRAGFFEGTPREKKRENRRGFLSGDCRVTPAKNLGSEEWFHTGPMI